MGRWGGGISRFPIFFLKKQLRGDDAVWRGEMRWMFFAD